jgi:hypothetical protein
MRVQSFLTIATLSHRAAVGDDAFSKGRSPWGWIFDVVLTIRVHVGPNLHGEARFYQDMLIQCQSYHVDYACPFGEVAVSGGHGTDCSTRVPAARCAWVTVATSCRTRH